MPYVKGHFDLFALVARCFIRTLSGVLYYHYRVWDLFYYMGGVIGPSIRLVSTKHYDRGYGSVNSV